MELVEKKYPYPVLRPNGDDYNSDCVFNLDGSFLNEDDKILLDINVQLECEALRILLEQKKVKIICHIECSLSAFRNVYEISLGGEHIEIPGGDLSGKVFVCPFIVACEDIQEYTSDLFNPIYRNLSFNISAGAVLAEGIQLRFHVEHEKNALEYQPDIFSVMAYGGKDEKRTMCVNLDGDKIKVFLPQRAFACYRNLKDAGQKEFLWGTVIFPALMEALHYMRDIVLQDDDVERLESLRWSRVLKAKIEKIYPTILEDPRGAFEGLPIMEIAQELTKQSTIKNLMATLKVEGDKNED